MPNPLKRGVLTFALAVSTATVVTTAVVPTNAFASHPGENTSPLSTYDSVAIHFADGTAIPAHSPAAEGAWSPDGSRFAYVSSTGAIISVRANDPDGDNSGVGGSAITLVDALGPGVRRHHPTWSAVGSVLLYSEQQTFNGPWSIGINSSTRGWEEDTVTPADGMDYTWPDAGPRAQFVAQRQPDDGIGNPTGTPEIVAISFATDVVTPVIGDASQPAMSPDGSRVAFVRSDGTHNQIWTSNMSGGDLVQVTADVDDHGQPAWSPDGTTIAFTSTSGIETASATGSDSAAPHLVSGLALGEPAYQPLNKNHVVELAGTNRFNTAVAISKSHWADAGVTDPNREQAKSVTLSRSDTFADAVSGSALAAAKHGPLLLTPPGRLDASTKAEIQRVLGSSTTATVYLLGGTGALSTTVENAIKAMHYVTKRVSGADRFATSVAIAKAISSKPAIFMVATGMNFPDALSAGAAAGSYNAFNDGPAVVLLSTDTRMPAATENYLDGFLDSTNHLNAWLNAVGDQANTALSSAGWSGYDIEAGQTRYDTARQVAFEFFGASNSAGVTTGLNWPDALAGGAFLAMLNAPLLLTSSATTLNSATQGLLSDQSGSISVGYIFGGTLPSSINDQIGTAISGPDGFDNALPSVVSPMMSMAHGLASDAGPSVSPKVPPHATTAMHR